ncbi:MAG: glycosyltransferase family 4 protein [Pirellulales bacterium]
MSFHDLRQVQNIGFVSTRISGTDGVSLEIAKWAEILEQMGYDCFYVAGFSDRPADRTRTIELADFRHPTIREITDAAFSQPLRTAEITQEIHEAKNIIKQELYAAIKALELELLIVENALTIPMNIPLGLALVEVIMESGIPCIAHHHDFVWERERFLLNSVEDYLMAAFPPPIKSIEHVIINSIAANEFSRRTGLSSHMIPNVMDFDTPPAPDDDYGRSFRKDLGLEEDDLLILQPTRVVRRKGIEHSIELVHRLDPARAKLVITHGAHDEGDNYLMRVQDYANLLGVELILAESHIAAVRGTSPDGRKLYGVWDAYQNADLVTYPSTYEGFGNAFLETVYYKKPIVCNRYSIYRTDIEPCGFRAIVMDGYPTDEVVDEMRQVLANETLRQEMVEHNYRVAKQYFSYKRVATELAAILNRPLPRGLPTDPTTP